MNRIIFFLFLWMIPFLINGQALNTADIALKKSIRALEKQSGGKLGLSALDLQTGHHFNHHAQEKFPMASVFKFPIAIHVLQQVQQGSFSLEDSIYVDDQYLRWGWSPITEKIRNEGPAYYSFKTLLEQMMLVSDNTACDILIEKTDGTAAITQTLRNYGIKGIRIDRTEHKVHADLHMIKRDQLARYSYQESH